MLFQIYLHRTYHSSLFQIYLTTYIYECISIKKTTAEVYEHKICMDGDPGLEYANVFEAQSLRNHILRNTVRLLRKLGKLKEMYVYIELFRILHSVVFRQSGNEECTSFCHVSAKSLEI